MFNSTIPHVLTDATQRHATVRPAMPCMSEEWKAQVAAREAQEEAQERDAQIARYKAQQAATEGAQIVSAARTPALTNVIPPIVSTDVPIAVPSHVITPDVVPSVVSSAPVPTQSSKLMQVKDMLSKAASSDYTMSSAAIAPALSSAPLSSDSSISVFEDMQAKAEAADATQRQTQEQDALLNEVVRLLNTGASPESLQGFGPARVAQAVQMQALIPLTAQQLNARYRFKLQEAKKELGRGYKTAGINVQQHKEEDFTHAICTQMDLQLQGENLSVSAVLAMAFPDPVKAKSIGSSTRMPRVRKAFKSEVVQRHPIEQAMQAELGARSMQLRYTPSKFSQSLGVNAAFFTVFSKLSKHDAEINALKADGVATKARVAELELQSKAHDVLSATGVRTKVSDEELLALRAKGMSVKEIGIAVGTKPDTVKKRLQRIKQ